MKSLPVVPPLLPDVGIMAMVPEAWGGPWQSRHFIASRLCRYFNILWYTPTREWREFLAGDPAHANWKYVRGRVAAGLEVYAASIFLPRVYRPASLSHLLTRTRVNQAEKLLRHMGAQKTVLYLWRPDYAWALDAFQHDLCCYHIDDEYTWSTREVPIPADEKRLIELADQVFVHSPAMLEKKGNINANTLMVPNGVQFSIFSAPTEEPVLLRSIPHPRIGYIGLIKPQLDFEKLLALARRHHHWSFVFVGPKGVLGEDAPLVQKLFAEPNVHYLGSQPLDLLPAYVQHFDVCTMCYRVNGYTKFIYPLKIHEYLATGRPVIGTPIRSLLDFKEVIFVADGVDEWSEAIEQALGPAAQRREVIALRKETARQHDWDLLVHRIARTVAERLGKQYLDRFDQATSALGESSENG